jgi:DNA-binding NarL/FixJ family response regulator
MRLKQLKILMVEDDPVVAEDICCHLRELGHQVLGPMYTFNEAMDQCGTAHFDLAILDIHLERHGQGITLALHIKSCIAVPVIFLTASSDERTLEEAKAAHPEHYLLKPFNSEQLKAALAIVMHNFRHPDSQQQQRSKLARFNKSLPEPLSKREEELLHLLLDGLSNEEMADALFLSLHTVKTHMKHIFHKTGAESRTQLISMLHKA